MFRCKPDFKAAQDRVNAFWACEETDRPLAFMHYRKPGAPRFPKKTYATFEERWLDLEYRADETAHDLESTVFLAESMPVAFPNLGPEIFSAWAGCPYNFGETTAWSEPCVRDWEADAPKAVVDWNHPLFKATEEFTRLLIERGRDSFIVGLTDFHPAGDHLAALRDPAELAMDLIERPDAVKAKLAASYAEYFAVYDHFAAMVKAAGMPISSWLPLTSESTMYIPSNDFSCMISPEMFEEFFLPGIVEECRHYGHSIYHLDGPNALRHLDALLAIPELDAIQWVPGAGHEEVAQWLGVYKKVLAAGKSVVVYPTAAELPLLMENLPARGVCLDLYRVKSAEEAEAVMKLIEKWPRTR